MPNTRKPTKKEAFQELIKLGYNPTWLMYAMQRKTPPPSIPRMVSGERPANIPTTAPKPSFWEQAYPQQQNPEEAIAKFGIARPGEQVIPQFYNMGGDLSQGYPTQTEAMQSVAPPTNPIQEALAQAKGQTIKSISNTGIGFNPPTAPKQQGLELEHFGVKMNITPENISDNYNAILRDLDNLVKTKASNTEIQKTLFKAEYLKNQAQSWGINLPDVPYSYQDTGETNRVPSWYKPEFLENRVPAGKYAIQPTQPLPIQQTVQQPRTNSPVAAPVIPTAPNPQTQGQPSTIDTLIGKLKGVAGMLGGSGQTQGQPQTQPTTPNVRQQMIDFLTQNPASQKYLPNKPGPAQPTSQNIPVAPTQRMTPAQEIVNRIFKSNIGTPQDIMSHLTPEDTQLARQTLGLNQVPQTQNVSVVNSGMQPGETPAFYYGAEPTYKEGTEYGIRGSGGAGLFPTKEDALKKAIELARQNKGGITPDLQRLLMQLYPQQNMANFPMQ